MSQTPIVINSVRLICDLAGVLLWPDQDALIVADLHLEKGNSLSRRAQILPPYDTAASLGALEQVLSRIQPGRVIALGDSFHDSRVAERLDAETRARLARLTGRHQWTWVLGNHDPRVPEELGGRVETTLTLGALTFRHEGARASGKGAVTGEVSGHYHPKAAVRTRAGRVRADCFVEDGQRVILPAFGAFTGGLDARDPAIRSLMGRDYRVHLRGRAQLHSVPARALE